MAPVAAANVPALVLPSASATTEWRELGASPLMLRKIACDGGPRGQAWEMLDGGSDLLRLGAPLASGAGPAHPA